MREIKFRAWDKDKKEMWNVESLYIADEYCYLNKGSMYSETATIKNRVLVIMQYTGLKDKNGKEVYEGDVVKVGTKKFQDEKDNIAEIRFYRGGFMMFLKGYFGGRDMEIFDGDCEKHEVIGNIYENPELFK